MKIFCLIIVIISSCLIILNFTSKYINGSDNESKMPLKSVKEALEEHTLELMSIEGVVGTAQGLCNGKPCIKVYVIKKSGQFTQRIPTTREGYPVVIEETGEFRARLLFHAHLLHQVRLTLALAELKLHWCIT